MDRRTFLAFGTSFGATLAAPGALADASATNAFINPERDTPLLCAGAFRLHTPQWWSAHPLQRPPGAVYVDGALIAAGMAQVELALRADGGVSPPLRQLDANFVAAQLSLLHARRAYAGGSRLACSLGSYGFRGVVSLSSGDTVDADTLLHELWGIALDLVSAGRRAPAGDCGTVAELFRLLQRLS